MKKTTKNPAIGIGLLFLFVLAAMSPVFSVSADPINYQAVDNNNTSCYSLDVIFLIDQSGSMGGDGFSPPNDPTGQRAYGPKWAIDWLTDNALDICPDAFHRVAVVNFGDEIQTPFQNLRDINPSNSEEWSFLRNELKNGIELLSLGQTDPERAFEKAIQLLNNAAPVGDSPRKRVIIFLTDGMPCVKGEGCNPPSSNVMDFVSYARRMKENVKEKLPFDATLLKQENCIKTARDIYAQNQIPEDVINKCLEDFRISEDAYEKSTYIYTMLLSFGEAWPAQLKEQYLEMSEQHGGQVVDLTQNRNDIPSNFLNIMTQLAGVPVTRLSCGNFAVNPYVRQARMTFFKLSEDTEVRLSYVDVEGINHEVVNGEQASGFTIQEHYSEGANERYVFDFPYPGIWRIESDACQGIEAYYEPIQLNISNGLSPVRIYNPTLGEIVPDNASLPEYDQPPYYNEQRPYFITFHVSDTEGNALDKVGSDFFDINFDVQVTGADGSVESYDMEWDSGDKLYKSTDPLKLPSPGKYVISINGSAPNKALPYGPVDGTVETVFDQQVELFRYESIRFEVFEVIPFKVEILTPQKDRQYKPVHGTILDGWPLTLKPFEFQARLVGVDGNALSVDQVKEIFGGRENDAFSAYLHQAVVPDDIKSEVINLTFNPENAVFSGLISEFAPQGDMEAVLLLNDVYLDHYRPEGPAEYRVPFNRVDGILSNKITYYLILALFILYILIRIIFCILNARHPISGRLIFENSGEKVFDLVLSGSMCARNSHVFGPSSPGLKENHVTMDVYMADAVVVPTTTTNKRVSNLSEDDDGAYDDGVDDAAMNQVKVRLILNSINSIRKLLLMTWKFFLPIPDAWWSRVYVMVEDGSNEYGDQDHPYTVRYVKI